MRVHIIVAVSALLVLLGGCAEQASNEPVNVDLARLVAEHEAYDGRVVKVSGRVASFADPQHYWLEDDEFHRVALLPEEKLSERVGEEVWVIGRFISDREQGRRIDVDALQPMQDAD